MAVAQITNITETEKIIITVITDNLADALRLDCKIAKRPTFAKNPADVIFHAEHGLAYHIETVVDGKTHCCLFDFASDAKGVLRNLDLLKINVHAVEALATSHDHFDHNAAMVEVLRAKKAEFRKDLPLYIGEQFFAGTYGKLPNRPDIFNINALKREEIEELGFVRIVEVNAPTEMIPGAWLPGKIEQSTDYEKILPMFLAKKDGEFVQETFIGEQAVILNAKGKGLVVLSGCGHRGIVNTVRHAQKVTGIDKVHVVIGGYHLINAKPELIQKTVADMKAINPDYIIPTHCTGFEAISAFAREMPDQFILNTAGTRYFI